jgi:glutathione synthase/RimK-type ligase-like ATP-grasp enzyme
MTGKEVGFGFYMHHDPLCAEDVACGWCRRERARNTPERVALRDTLDQRARVKARIVERAIVKRAKGKGSK